MIRKLIAVLLIGTLAACAPRTAAFLSEPAGATVTINGEQIGQTPCHYRYPLSSGGTYQVVLEKEGYQAVTHTIRADETDRNARNRWLLAGCIWTPLWLGALFTKKLKDGYEFVLRQVQAPVTAQVKEADRSLN